MRWGAVPWAIAMAYIAATLIPILAMILISLLFANLTRGVVTNSTQGANEMAVVAYALYLFLLCAGCHLGILLRVEALATK